MRDAGFDFVGGWIKVMGWDGMGWRGSWEFAMVDLDLDLALHLDRDLKQLNEWMWEAGSGGKGQAITVYQLLLSTGVYCILLR